MVGICADADTELFYTCVRSRPGCLQQLRPVGERNIVMCMSVCVSVYLPSKKSPGIRIRSSPIYYACNPWPWLGPPLAALQYVLQYAQYVTSGSMNDVMYAHTVASNRRHKYGVYSVTQQGAAWILHPGIYSN